jgi:hypothetical protein
VSREDREKPILVPLSQVLCCLTRASMSRNYQVSACGKAEELEDNIEMKTAVFWAVAPCSLVEIYRRFRGAFCLHHQ